MEIFAQKSIYIVIDPTILLFYSRKFITIPQTQNAFVTFVTNTWHAQIFTVWKLLLYYATTTNKVQP